MVPIPTMGAAWTTLAAAARHATSRSALASLGALLALPPLVHAQQAAPPGIVVERAADTMLGSTLGRISVVTPAGTTLGDVSDTILSHDGRVVALVVGVGGLLGLGEKPVAIRWEHLSVRPTERGFEFVCDLEPAVLDAAPRYRERER